MIGIINFLQKLLVILQLINADYIIKFIYTYNVHVLYFILLYLIYYAKMYVQKKRFPKILLQQFLWEMSLKN
jgi:ABC-type iron transport system FetAB permease component